MTREQVEAYATIRELEKDHEPDGYPAIRMRTCSALADTIDALNREIEHMSGIVEGLPKTADGVSIVKDCEVWLPSTSYGSVKRLRAKSLSTIAFLDDPTFGERGYPIPVIRCYSTREAAELAAKQEQR